MIDCGVARQNILLQLGVLTARDRRRVAVHEAGGVVAKYEVAHERECLIKVSAHVERN